MKSSHREQIDFLKKRIYQGDDGKQLFRKFKRRWQLSAVTYHRRVAIARVEIRSGDVNQNRWVVLNQAPKELSQNSQNATLLDNQCSITSTNQFVAKTNDQNYEERKAIFSTGAQAEKGMLIQYRKTSLNNNQKAFRESYQNEVTSTGQLSSKSNCQKKGEEVVRLAARKLLCAPETGVEDSLQMLTRFANGEYARFRQTVCRGQLVEIHETPNINSRLNAVQALLNYHTSRR